MKRGVIILFLFAVLNGLIHGQSFSNSNLPIVIINTDGGAWIPDASRVLGTMKIIYRGPGQRNYLTDQTNPAYLNYNGRINIETRGSSSQYTAKKQYGLSTLKADNVNNNNVSLLGMPAENDWILNGMVWDSAMIRDYLCFNLSRQLGEYASRTVYCEVVINGSYKGLYLLDEKIKADDNRVDIIEILPADNALPELSGGYITKADKNTGGDPGAWSMVSWYGGTVNYIHHMPEPADITTAQASYIRNYFFKFASAAQVGSINLETGYPVYIDIPSFINYIIIAELSSNADSYGLSTYFHKDRNGKLRAGPIWDSDLTFGNDLALWGYDRSHTDVWQFADGGNDGSRFWRDLYFNNTFRCYLSRRWNELIQPGKPLNPASLNSYIDQTVALISEAVARDYAAWGINGSHSYRISKLKTWLQERVEWMSFMLDSWSGCSNVDVPPLVITKIMFNPPATIWFPDGEELEFIEITNTGDTEVDLSGIYFAGTGLVYQFPYNSKIASDTSLYLAANSSTFYWRYGFEPFDQFTRHISNGGQNIVLSDAFGNVIDQVHFSDTVPWPEADGNGYYLKLPDPYADNNLPANWKASIDLLLGINDNNDLPGFNASPNPVSDILRLKADYAIESISLFDIQGRMLKTINPGRDYIEFDMAALQPGIYILTAKISGKTQRMKIIRK